MQKLRHLNSSTVDKDGVLQTTVTFGCHDVYGDEGYQSRQIVYGNLESSESPTDIWIVGVITDPYNGGVKRYACYPIFNIWNQSAKVPPQAYDALMTHIKNELNLLDCSIVSGGEVLSVVRIEPSFDDSEIIKDLRGNFSNVRAGDPKVTVWILQIAGIDTDKALPKLYDKLNCDYTRELPSLCRNGVEYFNVEFTENIDLLGYYDIVGYDYGLQVRALPRFYEIHSSGAFAEGPRGRVSLGVKK